jgi:Kef-type K+ transport system membrane component KefB
LSFLFQIGVLLITGFLFGELAVKARLPKISGYIIAGILLNPKVTGFADASFIESTNPLINLALSFITFAIGGTLSVKNIRRTGKVILTITLFEALMAYLFVFLILFFALRMFYTDVYALPVALSMSLLLGSLASPTDPSATLAITREYKAKGAVSSTVMGVAAFDDITGILFYTITISIAGYILGADGTGPVSLAAELGKEIGGSIATGIVYGFVFNQFSHRFRKETEGALIVMILAMLLLCYGTSTVLGFDELLGTMTMGMIVVNYHKNQEYIFTIMERYTDELIFVIFFTLSGLHLRFDALSGSMALIGIFVVARALGKYTGVFIGSWLTHAPPVVRKYTAGGLFPQGGIVIGLALLIAKKPALAEYSSLVISIVIGATIIHELVGPLLARIALKRAGEIGPVSGTDKS